MLATGMGAGVHLVVPTLAQPAPKMAAFLAATRDLIYRRSSVNKPGVVDPAQVLVRAIAMKMKPL
jgi:hypothetical protein